MGRQPVQEHYEEKNINLDLGFCRIGSGEDICLCTTGCVLDEVINARDVLKERGINAEIIDVFKIGKSLGADLSDCLKKHKKIICIEDHMSIGGLGTYISEGILENNITAMIRKISVKNIFPQSGSPDLLYGRYGINSKNIVNTSLDLLNK